MKNKKTLIKRIFAVVSCIVIIVSSFTITTSAHIDNDIYTNMQEAPFRYTTKFWASPSIEIITQELYINGVDRYPLEINEPADGIGTTRVDYSAPYFTKSNGTKYYYQGYQQVKTIDKQNEIAGQGPTYSYKTAEIQELYRTNLNDITGIPYDIPSYTITTEFEYLICKNPYKKLDDRITINDREAYNILRNYKIKTEINNPLNVDFISNNSTYVTERISFDLYAPIKKSNNSTGKTEAGYKYINTVSFAIQNEKEHFFTKERQLIPTNEIENQLQTYFQGNTETQIIDFCENAPIIFTNLKYYADFTIPRMTLYDNVSTFNCSIIRRIYAPTHTVPTPEAIFGKRINYDINEALKLQFNNSESTVITNVKFTDFDIISWFSNTVGGFFATPIFGAVTIGHILWFIVGMALFIMFLKVFAGG